MSGFLDVTAGLTLTPAPTVTTVRQESLSTPTSTAATVLQERSLFDVCLCCTYRGEQQIT